MQLRELVWIVVFVELVRIVVRIGLMAMAPSSGSTSRPEQLG